jgi:hypothetical protein
LECHEASKHHLLEFGFFLDTIKLGFLLRENSLLYSSNLPLGVPNWTVFYIINTATTKIFLAPLPGNEEEEAPTSTTCQQNINKFSGAVAGEKEDFSKGSFARTSFTLF